MKLIRQFYISFKVVCFLGYLNKSLKKKENNKEGNSWCYNSLVIIEGDRGDEILGFDLIFVG